MSSKNPGELFTFACDAPDNRASAVYHSAPYSSIASSSSTLLSETYVYVVLHLV